MSKEIENLCIFLKLLWEQLSVDYKEFNMSHMLREYRIIYASTMVTALQQAGILEYRRGKQGKSLWKWINPVQPNDKMAKALIESARNLVTKKNDTKTNETTADTNNDYPKVIKCESSRDAERLKDISQIIGLGEDRIVSMKNTILIDKPAYEILKDIASFIKKYIV